MPSKLSLNDIGARKLAINAERHEVREQIRVLDEQIAFLKGSRLALVEHDDALSTELSKLNEAQVSLLQQQLNDAAQAAKPEDVAGVNEAVQVRTSAIQVSKINVKINVVIKQLLFSATGWKRLAQTQSQRHYLL